MPPDADMSAGIRILYAFKEWAVIVDALGRGEQSIILRKGGIAEEGAGFQPEYPQFFLFPTFEHQKSGDLIPEAAARLNQYDAQEQSETIPIYYFAVLEQSFQIPNRETLRRFKGYHVWAEGGIERKFFWEPGRPLFLLLVRIFRLPAVFELGKKPSYGGCKSWVKLEEAIPVPRAGSVLSDAAFMSIKDSISGLLT